jgi:hypothetical protein
VIFLKGFFTKGGNKDPIQGMTQKAKNACEMAKKVNRFPACKAQKGIH